MPVEKLSSGKFRWGKQGKAYSEKWKAAKQGRAIEASEHRQKSSLTIKKNSKAR